MNTFKRLQLATLLLSALLLTACGGGGSATSGGSISAEQGRTASVSLIGEWAGNVSINNETEYMLLSLRQSGSDITARLYSRAGGDHDYQMRGNLTGLQLRMSGEAKEETHFVLNSDVTAAFLNGTVSQSGQGTAVSFERL